MKEKLRQFMAGRYGIDQLGRAIMAVSIGSLVLYMLTRSSLFYFLTIASLIWYYFRSMSRNCSSRYSENLKFLKLRDKTVSWFRLRILHLKQRKTHRFYSCPSCHQKIRVPKGHGTIAITCPKCRTQFTRKT